MKSFIDNRWFKQPNLVFEKFNEIVYFNGNNFLGNRTFNEYENNKAIKITKK
jgi:hypothetical protein